MIILVGIGRVNNNISPSTVIRLKVRNMNNPFKLPPVYAPAIVYLFLTRP